MHGSTSGHCPLQLLPLPPPAGTEPRGLYNVVLFLLHDRGGRGWVTLEEAMTITYLRVGKVGGGCWRSRRSGCYHSARGGTACPPARPKSCQMPPP